MSNIKQFLNEYNWNGIKYPSKKEDWKRFEKNNPTVALSVLYSEEMEMCPAYISKINSNCGKRIILSKIEKKKKKKKAGIIFQWKKVSALLYGITSKHKGEYNCFSCLHSLRTEKNLKSYFFGIAMPSEKDNILNVNQLMKSINQLIKIKYCTRFMLTLNPWLKE